MGKHRTEEKDFYFDYRFFRYLAKIAKILFPRAEWAVLFLIVLLTLSISKEVLTYTGGMMMGEFTKALTNKDQPQFWYAFATALGTNFGTCSLIALKSFASWQLYLSWRKNAVTKLQQRYFRNRAYYNINCIDDRGIDNPDQRITQDVEKICNQLAINILPSIIIGPFVTAFYTYKTYQTAGGMGVGIIYGYFVLGTIVNKFLVSPMVKWNARAEKAEGDFRYKHVSIRDNAESVALYDAESFEESECNRVFMELWWRQFKYFCWKLPNLFWQQYYDYSGAVLNYAVQFIPVFLLGLYDDVKPGDLSGIISKNAFVYIYLVNSFTRITDNALRTGEIAGILQRVAEFDSVCEGGGVDELPEEGYDNFAAVALVRQKEGDDDVIYDIQDVSYSAPHRSTEQLLEGLTLSICKGARIWITGPSGSGKSSLIRVLANLWQHETGVIRHGENRGQILRLSQVPYFPSGHLSLFQQISFPAAAATDGPERNDNNSASITGILNALKLGWLIERCQGIFNPVDFEWQQTLTPGEQQRLAFARVLHQRPQLAVLDESTSSVGVDIEERMYQLLISNNISFISVGHRPSLRAFHDTELQLDGQGGYTIRPISYQRPAIESAPTPAESDDDEDSPPGPSGGQPGFFSTFPGFPKINFG